MVGRRHRWGIDLMNMRRGREKIWSIDAVGGGTLDAGYYRIVMQEEGDEPVVEPVRLRLVARDLDIGLN